MMVCPQCGKRYPPGAEMCQVDGSRLSQLTEDPYKGYQIANFQLEKQIGRGGFGLVYLANHIDLGTQVAIKILRKQYTTDEQLVERFKREARVSSQIRHPNVVQISDFGFDETIGFYYIMEFLDGVSLSHVMKAYTRGMHLDRLLPIMQQMCSALDQAHSRNVVHRDLKPSNIFLIEHFGQKDVVKILDFGIAKVLQGEEGQGVTATGQIVGSPRFMSPEQARGRHSEVDPRSDIYALGVMLFWMLTGRLPFESKQLARLLFMHIKAPPPTLNSIRSAPHFTPQLEAVVAAALSKDKASRPPTTGELYNRLERACRATPNPKSRPLIDPFGTDPEDRTVRITHPAQQPPGIAAMIPSAMPDTPSGINALEDPDEGHHTIDVTRSLQGNMSQDDDSDRTHIDNIEHIHKMLDEKEASVAMASATGVPGFPSSGTIPPPGPPPGRLWPSSPPPPVAPAMPPEMFAKNKEDEEEATKPHAAPAPGLPSFMLPPATPQAPPVNHGPPPIHTSRPPVQIPAQGDLRPASMQPSPPPQRKSSNYWKTILLISLSLILLGEIVFLGWRWWKKNKESSTPTPPKRSERYHITPSAPTETLRLRQKSEKQNLNSPPQTG